MTDFNPKEAQMLESPRGGRVALHTGPYFIHMYAGGSHQAWLRREFTKLGAENADVRSWMMIGTSRFALDGIAEAVYKVHKIRVGKTFDGWWSAQ